MSRRRRFVVVGRAPVEVLIGEQLEIRGDSFSLDIGIDNAGIRTADGDYLTPDVVDGIYRRTPFTQDQASAIARTWLSERLGVTSDKAVEKAVLRFAPGVRALAESGLRLPAALSQRLFSALETTDAREASARYLDDSSTRSDGMAFAKALGLDGSIDESRASLFALVPTGDLRRELADAPTPVVPFHPPATVAAVTRGLSPRAAVDFTRCAMGDARSRLVLMAAVHEGLQAAATDGEAAWAALRSDVLARNWSSPRTPGEAILTLGRIGGCAIAKVTGRRALERVGAATRTCVGDHRHHWLGKFLRGDADLLSFTDTSGVIRALVAIGTSGQVLEMKAPGNVPVDADLAREIADAVRTTAGAA